MDPQQQLYADLRTAWWSPTTAARVRRAVAALPPDERPVFQELLAEADAGRRRLWLGPLSWVIYLLAASALVPPLILLGAPHLLHREPEKVTEKLEEELRPRTVYLPPPPPEEEEPPPVIDPERLTGPVRPTDDAAAADASTGPALETAPALGGVIGTANTHASPTWLTAFQDASGGSGEDDGEGTGSGIPPGMVYIVGGTFPMGSIAGRGEAHEHPRHPVALSPYAIDRDEVTITAFSRWCSANTHSCGWDQNHSASLMPDHPATGVTWNEARAYCRYMGKELPTEAQWEMAAGYDPGSGTKRTYPWGDAPPDCGRSNFLDCHLMRTTPVGSLSGASAAGVRDMAGNAREWVLDRHGSYPVAKQHDPRGPSSGPYRVLRGGSFGGGAEDVRATDRDMADPGTRSEYNGFRCAVAVETEVVDGTEPGGEEASGTPD